VVTDVTPYGHAIVVALIRAVNLGPKPTLLTLWMQEFSISIWGMVQ
jgi:hypothetical protein